jgi:hypothetical protein
VENETEQSGFLPAMAMTAATLAVLGVIATAIVAPLRAGKAPAGEQAATNGQTAATQSTEKPKASPVKPLSASSRVSTMPPRQTAVKKMTPAKRINAAGTGRTFYIAPRGSDSAAGGLSCPFATLKKFLTIAQPGDTAYIRGGTYDGHSAGWSRLKPTCSGTADNWITIRNYAGETPVIDTNRPGLDFTFMYLNEVNSYMQFSGLSLKNFSKGFSCEMSVPPGQKSGETAANESQVKSGQLGPGDLVFDNLHVSYCGSWDVWGGDGKAIRLSTGSHDITIRDSEFDHCNGPGIFGIGDVRNVTIQNLKIHDNSDGVESDDSSADGITFDLRTIGDGYATEQYPSNVTIRNVQVWNCRDDGIDLKGDNFIVSDCTVWNVGMCAYKAWSVMDVRQSPSVAVRQGHFTFTDCVGFDAGQDVFKASWMPYVDIENCVFVASDYCTAEKSGYTPQGGPALRYKANDPNATWTGYLKVRNSVFLTTSELAASVCVDAEYKDAKYDTDYNSYYNAANPSHTYLWRNNGAYHYYSASEIGGSGALTTATGQEVHGAGVRAAIAPMLVATSLPQNVSAGVPQTFSATAVDPDHKNLAYSWNFGDGSPVQTGQSLQYAYGREGAFIVTLTISGGEGKKTQHVSTIRVQSPAPASKPAETSQE